MVLKSCLKIMLLRQQRKPKRGNDEVVLILHSFLKTPALPACKKGIFKLLHCSIYSQWVSMSHSLVVPFDILEV